MRWVVLLLSLLCITSCSLNEPGNQDLIDSTETVQPTLIIPSIDKSAPPGEWDLSLLFLNGTILPSGYEYKHFVKHDPREEYGVQSVEKGFEDSSGLDAGAVFVDVYTTLVDASNGYSHLVDVIQVYRREPVGGQKIEVVQLDAPLIGDQSIAEYEELQKNGEFASGTYYIVFQQCNSVVYLIVHVFSPDRGDEIFEFAKNFASESKAILCR